jgi:hypothetical protein
MPEIKYTTPLVHYLTINGRVLTPNTTVFPSSLITGMLHSGTVLTDWKATPNICELSINLTVQSLGIGASLTPSLLVLDPIESANGMGAFHPGSNTAVAIVQFLSTPLSSSPSTLRFTISRSGAVTLWEFSGGKSTTIILPGNMPVPFKWQMQFNVNGTVGLIATYEGRA